MDKTMHTLPKLPYAYDALEPYIDEETMKLHHDKHHATYIKNLNDALEKHPQLFEKTAEDLIKNLSEVPEDIRATVANNGGGHVNHSMFWQIMGPSNGGERSNDSMVKEIIAETFGGFVAFQNQFNDAGMKRFGSGWVWLVRNKEHELKIISTSNQDNPISQGLYPIMGNDVWEHAYYVKYRNMRADYLKAWWNVVNWVEVERRFQ